MKLEQRMAAVEAELAAIKAEILKKDEWPKVGDKFFYINLKATVESFIYRDDFIDKGLKLLNNLFHTEQEAEAELKARKVIAELRQCNGYRPFILHSNNYCLDVSLETPICINITHGIIKDSGWQSIYFKSTDTAETAIEKIGRDRIIKTARWLAMRET